jgi:Predicted nucleotide-binding protein containing TIR-like domain
VNQRASVFVGSCSEGLLVAKAIQKALDSIADVNLWSQGIFAPSYSYLESLIKALETTDFAVLVLTPDDLTQSRDHEAVSPRDNVIFELGLFMGRLGRDRCFFVFDRTKDLKLPTDLLGVAAATYHPHDSGNIHAAIGPACTLIEEKIQALGQRPRLLKAAAEGTQLNANVPSLSGKWAGYFIEGSSPKQQNRTLEIEQHGAFVRATITTEVKEGTRIFDYEGWFTSG